METNKTTKVKKHNSFLKHFNVFGLHVYLTTTLMKRRQVRDNKSESRKRLLDIKSRLVQKRGCKCEMCGQITNRFCELQVHHVLPLSRYPQFDVDKRNVMLVCQECHYEIHHNPFLEAKMIREKADELGVDLKPFNIQ